MSSRKADFEIPVCFWEIASSSTPHPLSEPRENRLDWHRSAAAKLRLSGPPGSYEWRSFFVGRKCSRLGLSFIQDALSGFCVLGGFRPHKASSPHLSK